MPSIRGAAAAALAALVAAVPAAYAHEGNPNYSSDVRSITPAVPGLGARVLDYDDGIELSWEGDEPLVVEGYRDEPYLRFLPGGRVEINRRSPAAYLNEDRFAQVELPGRADHEAPPEWSVVSRTGTYGWHDHRIHWMSESSMPPQIEDEGKRTKIFDWKIPMEAGGQPVTVSGTLTWLGDPGGGFPVAAGVSLAAVLVASALFVAIVRRRRSRGARPAQEAW